MLAVALVFYLLLAVGGGVTYYLLNKTGNLPWQKENVVRRDQPVAATPPAPASETVEDAPPPETAATTPSSAEQRLDELRAEMIVTHLNGVAIYHYEQDKHPPTGVYLRPFIVETPGGPIMKNDIYYFASLDDGGFFDWIRGDALYAETGAGAVTLYLDETERHDRLGKGAESLFENYVFDADAETMNLFRAIAAAGWGRITYYNRADGKSLSGELSAEAVRRIARMVELYDLLEAAYR